MAKDSGNKLTQTIKEDGTLVSVENMNTTEGVLSENEIISSADIRKELFQGDNIRMRNDPTGPEDENKESGQGDGAGEGESETTPSTSTDDKE